MKKITCIDTTTLILNETTIARLKQWWEEDHDEDETFGEKELEEMARAVADDFTILDLCDEFGDENIKFERKIVYEKN